MAHPDQIRRIARRFPEKICVVEGDRSLTFAEVDRRADLAADAWLADGLVAGERVAVLAHNELEYLEFQIAAQRAGLVLVPLNTRFKAAELQQVLNDCQPRVLIQGPGFDEVGAALDVQRRWHLGTNGAGDSYEARLQAARATPRPVADPDALASLLYTSGTTGHPKGAMISNRALLARSLSLGVELAIGPDDVFLQALPMFHLAQTFSCAFAMLGATNVMLKGFDPKAALAALGRYRVTHTLMVPMMIRMLVEHPDLAGTDRSALRALLYGGSSISQAELRRALDAFRCGFFQMYGMTETGPATLLRPAEHDPAQPQWLASAGSDIVTFDVAVVDHEGQACAPGARGEIVIDGPALMSGYWQRPQETATALRGGRMHTGDVGHFDTDGLLHVTDRLKDIIISGGENVSSTEVEKVLMAHASVAECAVVAVPDERLGERVHAVVVLAANTTLSESDLDTHCRELLAGYKRPRSYSVSPVLPRTATGKVQKNLLRDALKREPAGP
ncbi:MAG: AMP-binding protein [Burkholderiales bacterium]